MKTISAWSAAALVSACAFVTPATAAVLELSFTGQYTLVDSSGNAMDQQAIASTLTYNTDTGFGAGAVGGMTIDNFDTFGNTATIYSISLDRVDDTNYIVGNMLADWGGSTGVPISMVWDATGLINAIEYGLEAGDVISGTDLKRDGFADVNVFSATPASDGLTMYDPSANGGLGGDVTLAQGPAPLAVTTWNTTTVCTPGVGGDCLGNPISGGAPLLADLIAGSPMIDGPFPGLNVNFDIGSGNSITVNSVTTVPVPAAAWLFGSGLIGLVGVARNKRK